MKVLSDNIIKILLGLSIVYFLILGLANDINLPTADLGRHITNGQIIMEAAARGLDLKTQTPLFKNFYSYTQPNFDVINHHWFIGVIHAFIHDNFGFVGLSIANITAVMLASLFLFLAARLFTSTNYALIALILALPLLTWRTEVRPEEFSYMFMGFELLLIALYIKEKISFRTTAIFLAITQMIWINTHIFFAFGLFIIGAFWINAAINKSGSIKEKLLNPFFFLGLIATAACLINPSGLTGLLIPLNIFKTYGYMLVENQSVFFAHKRFPNHLIYYYFDFVALITLISFFLPGKKSYSYNAVNIIVCLVLGALAFKTSRSIPVFAYISIFVIAQNLYLTFKDKLKSSLILSTALLLCVSGLIYFYHTKFHKTIRLGLEPNINASANFFKANNIQGPIFNNYDIGGYLIYHLFPYRRVFVDNRPEAYSVKFFDEVYEPMQESEEKWHEVDNKIKFNTIFFFRHDMTEHAQPFLIRRLEDPDWIPVFVDRANIILVRNNELNKDIIEKYKLPDEIFRVVKTEDG